MQLELTTSPRSTWIWVPDGADVEDVRIRLGRWIVASPRAGVFDVEIGADAYEALALLAEAGYTFRWHASQHLLNQTPEKFGIPVSPSL